MSVPLPWSERKFEFDFPREMHHNLRVRMRGAPARLEELMASMPAPRLVEKVQGKWSIQENTGHLTDMEAVWAEAVDAVIGAKRKIPAHDPANPATEEAQHNLAALGRILDGFRGGRLTLMARLDELKDDQFDRFAIHPVFGVKLRLVDMLYLIAEHDDHHMARIWALRELRIR